MKVLPHVKNKEAMVLVFMMTELLSDESRVATSSGAAARHGDACGSCGFSGRAKQLANQTANSHRRSALAGCGG